MNTKLFKSVLTVFIFTISFNSHAIKTGDLLSINTDATAGSWWAWDFSDNGSIDSYEKNSLLAGTAGGLIMGSTSTQGEMTAASNYLLVDSYLYLPNTAVTVLSDDGSGNLELDFSGLNWDFGALTVSLAGNSIFNDTGIATLSCSSSTCGNGDTFIINYSAHNLDPNNGYGELLFAMELTGTVSAVPVPAAVWLFGSGLIGLIGVARRKKA